MLMQICRIICPNDSYIHLRMIIIICNRKQPTIYFEDFLWQKRASIVIQYPYNMSPSWLVVS